MATKANRRQVVMTFDERPDLRSSRLRGGKGSHLAGMRALGLPVPAGFTITTTVARGVMQNEGRFPNRLEGQLKRAMEAIEKETGKRFGDIKNPLLFSVRSGAEVSMPGMMDTILNLGMNEQIRDAMASATNEEFAADCYRRFLSMYRDTVGVDVVPSDPQEQLRQAIVAVIASWMSERAVAYRKASGISESLGTAVTIQTMVFGNRCANSGTGVVFSRDPNTGAPGLYGEFLPQAQGEDVVSGSHTPLPIAQMATWNAGLYNELVSHAALLEEQLDTIVDIEFTIEQGKLYLLQCRPAKLSSEAAATFAVHRVWCKRWDHGKALASLTPAQLESIDTRPCFAVDEMEKACARIVGKGISASPGAAVGKIATTSEDACAMSARGESVVLIREETTPNDLSGMLVAKAIVTLKGGATSHAAVVARQLGIPATVGIGGGIASFLCRLPDDTMTLSVCGTSGTVYAGALPVVAPTHKKEINIFRKWVGNTMPAPRIDFDAVKKRVNVNSVLADVYLLEAMALASKGCALGYEIAKLKCKVTLEIAELFACYLCIAVASELRHVYSRGVSLPLSEKQRLGDMYKITPDHARGDERILDVLKVMTLEEQVEFFRFAAKVFRTDCWSGSFGGSPWGDIAETGTLFLTKEINHAVFVDRLFDLRHNNGPIFNKHAMMTAVGHNPTLQETLLDEKRSVTGVEKLFARLKSYASTYMGHSAWNKFSPSQEVLAVWEKGCQTKLWKDISHEHASSFSRW